MNPIKVACGIELVEIIIVRVKMTIFTNKRKLKRCSCIGSHPISVNLLILVQEATIRIHIFG